jgi:hypothetical protein
LYVNSLSAACLSNEGHGLALKVAQADGLQFQFVHSHHEKGDLVHSDKGKEQNSSSLKEE